MSNIEFHPNDQKVIYLLSKLKNSNGAYPSEILTARRQDYLRQVANIGLGIGIGAGIKNAAKGGNGAAGTVATVTSKILEAALIAAIAIEAGAVAYLYRDKIAELVRTYTGSSNVQEVLFSSGSESPSSSELVDVSTAVPTVVAVSTLSGTVTVTVTSGTPTSEEARDINNSSNNGATATGINATPKPGGNNGNHYGQTPKPERTKDKDNNNGNNNTSDNKKRQR